MRGIILKLITAYKLTKTVFTTDKVQLNEKVSLFWLRVKIIEIIECPYGFLS
jgi:hypothetical protein